MAQVAKLTVGWEIVFGMGITHALYNEPKLLVLDETTSSLESETEKKRQQQTHERKAMKRYSPS